MNKSHIEINCMYIGQNLKEIRERLGFSLGQVASKLGINPKMLEKIENGIQEIRAPQLYLFCKTFNVNINEIYKNCIDFDC